jgi:hypothetical protein
MVEIEFSALSRQCLNRRISSLDELVREVFTYMRKRDKAAIKINWEFVESDVRTKLNSSYRKVN